jgi:hypothetical protein
MTDKPDDYWTKEYNDSFFTPWKNNPVSRPITYALWFLLFLLGVAAIGGAP